VGLEKLHVDARNIIEAFEMGMTDQTYEIFVALIIHGKKDEMVRIVRTPLFIEAGLGSNVCLTADYGFYAMVKGAKVKVYSTEHVSMVGYAARRYPVRFGEIKQTVETDGAVEKTELRVQVKMDEFAHLHVYGC
jgi:hypothetical protein